MDSTAFILQKLNFKEKKMWQNVPKNAHQCAFNRNNKLVYANKLINDSDD